MNKDFILGYVLGSDCSENTVENQETLPDEWVFPSDRPSPPEPMENCKFTYILARQAQIAELDFYNTDCAGITVDWGDGTLDTTQQLEGNKYGFVQNNNSVLYHVYNSFRDYVWIKVTVPLSSSATFRTYQVGVYETVRNCGCLVSIMPSGNEALTAASDTCYCKDDVAFISSIKAINKEIIFIKNDTIYESLTVPLNSSALYIEIKGEIPAKKFFINGTGTKLRSAVIENAGNITDISNPILNSQSSVLSRFIVLNADKAEKIVTAVSSVSEKLKKVQILASGSEISENGIIVKCPVLKYIGNIVNNSCMSNVSVNIETGAQSEFDMKNINYSFSELVIKTYKLTKPINITLDSCVGSNYKFNVKKIRADIAVMPEDGVVWGKCFFSATELDSIFDTAEEFYPPFLVYINTLCVMSVYSLNRAIKLGMVRFTDRVYGVSMLFNVPSNDSALSDRKGNSFEDINRLIRLLPKVNYGKLAVCFNYNGQSPEIFEKEISRHIDYELAESKNWSIIPQKKN